MNKITYQPLFYLATQRETIGSLKIGKKDREVLKILAQRVAEIAADPIQDEKRKLWYSHNVLKDTRPIILCFPERGWDEIIPEDQLICKGKSARKWEKILRKEIFWGETMGDDYVVEPYFNIPYTYYEGDWGMHETVNRVFKKGSYQLDSPLKDYKDLDKLHFPKLTFDYDKTKKVVELAKEIMGDYLSIRIRGRWWHSLGLTHILADLRGIEQLMLDMYDYPKELHRLMSMLRDYTLYKIDFTEKNGLLTLNSDCFYFGGGVFGYTYELPQKDFNNIVRPIDMWGWSESQETVGISPEMFEEFIFKYQLPIIEKFGLVSYGCCEPLNNRWNIIKRIPNLRRVSVAPSADLRDMAQKLSSHYIYAMKPNPADLAVNSIDEDYIRKKLREAMRITRDCHVEIIMKDNHTIGNNPQNVIKWCKIAIEEAKSL